MRARIQIIFITLIFITLSACGGNSAPTASIPLDSPSGINALTIAEQVSYVTAQEDLTSSSNLVKMLTSYAVPTSGQYITDEPEYYVYDESMQAMDVVNSILCSVKQTRYDLMVNEGDYSALVDYNLCDRNVDSSSNQSSGQSIDYERWVINSYRASETSEQIIYFWVDKSEDSDSSTGSDDPTANLIEIRGKMVITEASSDENPFGTFHFDIFGFNSSGDESFYGFLDSEADEEGYSHIQMDITSASSSYEFNQIVDAYLNIDSDSGNAYSQEISDDYTRTAKVAFNSNYYKSYINDSYSSAQTTCFDRDEFNSSVWQYNLYSKTGARVELNSGFPIVYGDDAYGYANYYGVWLPENQVTMRNGLTVTNEDETYTTLVGGGYLNKTTRTTGTLSDINNETFNYWSDTGDYYQVKWNGSHFVAFTIQTCSYNGCRFEEMTETNLSFDAYEWISLWKDGFGTINFIAPEAGLSNSTTITYYSTERVVPSDLSESLTLYCYYNCPRSGLTATHFNNQDVYLPELNDDYFGEAEAYEYTFDPDEYMLTYNGKNVTIATGTDIDSSSYYSWGFSTGSMVTSPLDYAYEVWSTDISYSWETGPNSWNKFTTLVDSDDDVVEFDPPMHCNYTHPVHGSYVLEYGGEGQLWGIPYELTEDDSTGNEYWTSLFVIPDGSSLSCDETTYYSKAMVVEQRMQSVSSSHCSSLTLPSVTEVDDLYVEPDIGSIPDAGEPAFIGGIAAGE